MVHDYEGFFLGFAVFLFFGGVGVVGSNEGISDLVYSFNQTTIKQMGLKLRKA